MTPLRRLESDAFGVTGEPRTSRRGPGVSYAVSMRCGLGDLSKSSCESAMLSSSVPGINSSSRWRIGFFNEGPGLVSTSNILFRHATFCCTCEQRPDSEVKTFEQYRQAKVAVVILADLQQWYQSRCEEKYGNKCPTEVSAADQEWDTQSTNSLFHNLATNAFVHMRIVCSQTIHLDSLPPCQWEASLEKTKQNSSTWISSTARPMMVMSLPKGHIRTVTPAKVASENASRLQSRE